MKKTKFLITVSAFSLAFLAAYAGSKSHNAIQYNYKDATNVCTFYSNTDPCGGGTSACTVNISGVARQIYQANGLQCVTPLNDKQP